MNGWKRSGRGGRQRLVATLDPQEAAVLRGLVDEVRRLETDGLRDGVTASRALGYAQVLGVLDGRWDLDAARELTVVATRRFARRRRAWFRRDPRVHWLDAAAESLPQALAHWRG